jgi:hypothetical protein
VRLELDDRASQAEVDEDEDTRNEGSTGDHQQHVDDVEHDQAR